MIYRDDTLAAVARAESLARVAAALRRNANPRATKRLQRAERALARAQRAVGRLQHGVFRFLPRSLVEVGVALALAWAVIVLGMGLLFVGMCVSSLLG